MTSSGHGVPARNGEHGVSVISASSHQRIVHIPNILPHERVFPIQIGTELFKLSGASLSSDAPSYFSQYFLCQLKQASDAGQDPSTAIRTLYIDRDPVTFKDISLHLQGYHVRPRDATHLVRLFADAQFYSLPKLMSQLYEEPIHITIGSTPFQIPREIFSLSGPGNTPNFFTLGFAMFFSNPEDLFPGLDKEGLIRPPSIVAPNVPNRSAEVFQELLHMLRGYPVKIRDERHRQELLKDCRWYNFKGLEQRLIPHEKGFNQVRGREEIVLGLRDIMKSGISVANEPVEGDPLAAWVNYARPYADDKAMELVLEIGEEATQLHIGPGGKEEVRAEFFTDIKAKMAKLFEVIATKLNLPPFTQPSGLLMAKGGRGSEPSTSRDALLSEDLVRVILDPEASITLDGQPWTADESDQTAHPSLPANGTTNNTPGTTIPSASSSSGGPSTAETPDSINPSTKPSPFQQSSSPDENPNPRKRRRLDSSPPYGVTSVSTSSPLGGEQWIVKTGQWRLRIQSSPNPNPAKASVVECCLVAVKLDALSSERKRNERRGFLGG
ncbi:hypothetical protein GE21DRAFT_3735 [Neurospora crassa]|uniref:Potassium channel tetramerisation-type BTB domain-containing protein n=2 Tax=Neurospora crassa TaxID=5141 RepID=Q7SC14_NEUCR|nr:hypothetical protein NCU09466 [Neurospora crassa OR74A]EAA33985.2 hypothetical protein NCU09466 [Neurospora crassa OR74A]KHE83362.1 hypothetical protein GE21DRAFT_3735 [Neurospora crassa]CAE75714.1 conserved hypothetical protein [Neurospora crassa]|eukprot:XP_963221.2 hypothetical protein NCU09466 [Neurospora crassa OR74A]